MDLNIQQFKKKLEVLDNMLKNLKGPLVKKGRVRELRRSVYVLKKLLADERNIVSPYGPGTPIIRQSLN